MFEGLFQPFHLLILLFCLLTFFVFPLAFYLITLQKALTRCSPEFRATSPSSVWWMMIPFFNLVYHFIVVGWVSTSLDREFRRRGMKAPDGEFGRPLGIAVCVLNVATLIPFIGFVAMAAAIICWILYWMKIADYSGMIALPSDAPMPLGTGHSSTLIDS